jgi:uncharacterized membrane protein YccC
MAHLPAVSPPDWLTPPDWLITLVKPKPAPIPWPAAARAALALGTPLLVCWSINELPYGLFMAMGALSGAIGDRRGPYRVRALQIGLAAFFGASGFAIGQAIFKEGWITFVVLCAVALFTALASVAGTIAATASLQMLVFTIVASSKAFPPPMWRPPVLFLAGGAWALGLAMLGVLRDSASAERRVVSTYLVALADLADAVGTEAAEEKRRAVTDRLNEAYDALLSGRVRSGGRHRTFREFMGLLNATTPLIESTVATIRSGRRPPEHIAPALREVATAVAERRTIPELPSWEGETAVGTAASPTYPHPTPFERLRGGIDQLLSGPATWTYALRLTLCIAVAELVRQVVPTGRSYWIALTAAVVLKSDFGSVFARAIQRAGGTLVGVAIGAALLELIPRGIGDVVAIAALAFMLPIALQRQYGMFTTFLTPLVVLLVDLLAPHGWSTLGDRLVDTCIGCGIVVVLGYLLWPETFRTRIGPYFVKAVDALAAYSRAALLAEHTDRGPLRRAAYRSLSDLRTVFQQALAEPPMVSRRASAWWPAIVALERLADAITQAAIRIDHGTAAPPSDEVTALADGISELALAVAQRRAPRPSTTPIDTMLHDIDTELRTARKIIAGPGLPVG